ncbi:hypothetical protein MMC22_009543 [Lobaria immixta]|nr:hypothetical protein [Lobaria immixta]
MADFPKVRPADGDQDRAATLLAVVISTTLLSTATVLLRVYTRIKVLRNLGWDDYTIIVAQALSILGTILIVQMVVNGVGRHMYYLPIDHIVNAGLYFVIVEITYIVAIVSVKCSVCLFLLRIMARGTSKRLPWFLYLLMAVMTVLSIATTIVILLQCTPPARQWDPRVKGTCRSYPKRLGIGYAQMAWSICTDVICALFPILILWKSKMNKRAKYAVWAIMGVGLLAGMCCIVKMVYLEKLAKGDFTYNGVDINIWGSLEQNIGVIAASVPALQPLFKSLLCSSHSPSQSQPGARNNVVLSTWMAMTNAFSTRSRTFNNTGSKAGFDSDEHILSSGVDRLQHDGAALGGHETRVKGAKYSGTGIA